MEVFPSSQAGFSRGIQVARDNHPRFRQARQLARKRGTRPTYDRILIVSEGEKTEPQYFEDIRIQNSIPSAHIKVLPSRAGTSPRLVVDFAEETFLATKAFERVYAVFDRDDHESYRDALARARALDGKYRNDERHEVVFKAVPSVPCFELWLLLHYEEVHAFYHRTDILDHLRWHIPGYQKGTTGIYQLTEPHIELAVQRAQRLQARFRAATGTDPFTGVGELVELLRSIRRE
jgi:hypothetical protein